jgi:uncharacterized hydrophobic protein (TIGR00271 family)
VSVESDLPDGAALPGHAKVVVVPVANPANAADLLELAVAFGEPDSIVQALSVVLGDAQAEADSDAAARLREVVERVASENTDRRIELVARPATSVARGIIESAREAGADLLLLGVPPVRGDDGSLLGKVAESVVEVAPCDVVVVRPGLDGEAVCDATRVVVAVDGDLTSQTASRTGVVLGDGLHLPVEVVHVQDRGRPRLEGHGVLAASLDGVEGGDKVRRRLLVDSDVAHAVTEHAGSSDLVLVGLQRHGTLQQWLFGSVATDLLRNNQGPVLVVARHVQQQGIGGWFDRARRWLTPGLTDVEAETLLWQARRQAPLSVDYVTLLVLSALLASLGLVQDSVAVIIGAMLVAPLLGPLSAASIGLVTARTPLLRRGLVTVAVGTAAAIAVSLLLGLALPLTGPTEQMLLRGSPTLLDVGVAMASGLVGAYATARKDIPAALAGVAIAAALVPPISTIALGIALGDRMLATGALLLYLVNVAAVTATGAAAFWWFGLRPVEQDAATRRRLVSAALGVALAFAVVVSVVGLVQSQRERQGAERDLARSLATPEDVELVEIEFDDSDEDVLVVTATLRTERELTPEEIGVAEDRLAAELGRRVRLRVVVERLLTP